MTLPVSLSELFDASERQVKAEIHVGIPAKVVKYDAVANTVDAEIVVRNALFDSDGAREYETFPSLPAVPVMWPRAGGKIVRLPLEPGDFVWLAFADAGLGEWRLTGQLSDPKDARRHSIGYAYAIPGAFPDVTPLAPADAAEIEAGAVIIGEDGGAEQIIVGGTVPGVRFGKAATSPVALAPAVAAFMAAVTAWIKLASPRIAAMPAPLTPAEVEGLAAALAVVESSGGTDAVAAVPSTLVKSE